MNFLFFTAPLKCDNLRVEGIITPAIGGIYDMWGTMLPFVTKLTTLSYIAFSIFQLDLVLPIHWTHAIIICESLVTPKGWFNSSSLLWINNLLYYDSPSHGSLWHTHYLPISVLPARIIEIEKTDPRYSKSKQVSFIFDIYSQHTLAVE